MTLRFTKMHGAGNDFIVLDLRNGSEAPSPELCRAMANRHTGIGCDQLLSIEAPRTESAIASYRIWNADGSTSQQCGNGARCISAWLHSAQQAQSLLSATREFFLDSPAGTHAVRVLDNGWFEVGMGVPHFAPQSIPLNGYATEQEEYSLDLVTENASPQSIRFGAVSMGNPHLVIEVSDIDIAPVTPLGPRLQANAILPESGNIGFVQIISSDQIRLRVYERGVGETLACGSGACAAVAVLAKRGRISRAATVAMSGGELRVVWPSDDAQVRMAGPAAFVYQGEWLQ